jgi:hypothetical protein
MCVCVLARARLCVCVCVHISESRDSVVGIATGYGLHDRGVGVRVLVG